MVAAARFFQEDLSWRRLGSLPRPREPKIKVFFWLIPKNSILTKDNLIKRGWQGSEACVFCGQKESIDHPFLQCSVAKLVWSLP